jgi:Late competence development protein ComFB
MHPDFSSVHNHYELPVFEVVAQLAPDYAYLDEGALPDVACVALNRLGARYIRHSVDLAFYLTEKERHAMEQTVKDAVVFAFEFVQARMAMKARC